MAGPSHVRKRLERGSELLIGRALLAVIAQRQKQTPLNTYAAIPRQTEQAHARVHPPRAPAKPRAMKKAQNSVRRVMQAQRRRGWGTGAGGSDALYGSRSCGST